MNVTVREFESYLLNHEELLTRLSNLAAFKEDVWKSFIKSRFDLYRSLLDKHQAAEARRKEIQQQATRERTQWEEVIDIFNDRFVVPFKLEPLNREAVILGQQDILTLGFTFQDGNEQAPVEPVERQALMQVLSTGEQKAMYVLNLLFEVEVRKNSDQDQHGLIVVDDIADSFDYKNKYAMKYPISDGYLGTHALQATHPHPQFRLLPHSAKQVCQIQRLLHGV